MDPVHTNTVIGSSYLLIYKCIGLLLFSMTGTNIISFMLPRILALLAFAQQHFIVSICFCKVFLFVWSLCTGDLLDVFSLSINKILNIKVTKPNASILYKTLYFGEQSTLGDLHYFIQTISQSSNDIIFHLICI